MSLSLLPNTSAASLLYLWQVINRDSTCDDSLSSLENNVMCGQHLLTRKKDNSTPHFHLA